jgi:hypothetical protein
LECSDFGKAESIIIEAAMIDPAPMENAVHENQLRFPENRQKVVQLSNTYRRKDTQSERIRK